MSPRFIDCSHSIEHGMRVFGNLPSPRIEPILTHEQSRPNYDNKAEFYMGRFEMASNTGTYLDSPFHRFKDGMDVSQIPLDRLAGLPGVVADSDCSSHRAVHLDLDGVNLRGRALLVRTGWDALWGTPGYWEPGPYLSDELVTALVCGGAAMVGVDFVNIDNTDDKSRPAHTRLLQAGVIVVEHLCNLKALPPDGFDFYAVPLPIVRGPACPVRAFAQIP